MSQKKEIEVKTSELLLYIIWYYIIYIYIFIYYIYHIVHVLCLNVLTHVALVKTVMLLIGLNIEDKVKLQLVTAFTKHLSMPSPWNIFILYICLNDTMNQTVYFIDRRLVSIAGTVTLVNKKFGNNEMLIICLRLKWRCRRSIQASYQ